MFTWPYRYPTPFLEVSDDDGLVHVHAISHSGTHDGQDVVTFTGGTVAAAVLHNDSVVWSIGVRSPEQTVAKKKIGMQVHAHLMRNILQVHAAGLQQPQVMS